jgi:hypothetical protein
MFRELTQPEIKVLGEASNPRFSAFLDGGMAAPDLDAKLLSALKAFQAFRHQ